jgi:hypothetical protein
VSNYNPKILFTQALSSSCSEKEDFYFQRSPSSLGKCSQAVINSACQRAPSELIHQLSNPDFYSYNPHKYLSITASNKKKDTVFTKSISRYPPQGSPTKKDLLKLNRITQEFKEYIDSNEKIDLEKL